jgi:hypothetical protein
MGLVDDWTHRHLIFSNPGTLAEAVAQGRFKQWYRAINDPRYIMQQMKWKSALIGSWPHHSPKAPPKAPPKTAPKGPHRDWAFSLGNGGGVAQNMYPAKFTWDVNATPDCVNDFVVYGLNVAGVTGAGGQANLVALKNLYANSVGEGYCHGTAPTLSWAYNVTTVPGGTVSTSPALSMDGTKVIFVESASSGSYLHVLIWISGQGTLASPVPPFLNEPAVGSCVDQTIYSCLVSVKLTAGAVTSSSITNSSPFYDYTDDTVYVGDDAGNLWKVTGVLNGTPTVTTLSVAPGTKLTGAVYDPFSGNVFVGSTNGALYAVTASTLALASTTPLQVGDTTCTAGTNGSDNALIDPPIVDGTNGWVYEYATTGSDGTSTVVEQASTTLSSGEFTGTTVVDVGSGDPGCLSPSGGFPSHSPEFDNTYYTGTVTSGHMWVCGRNGSAPALWEVPTSGANGALADGAEISPNPLTPVSDAQCSPLTEIYNGTTDYLFAGEGDDNSGNTNFGSLYGFTLGGTMATTITGSPITYPNANGGTSGIVVDNVFLEPLWQPSTHYTDNTLATDSNGNVEDVESCSGTCTSGASAPVWTVGVPTTVAAAIGTSDTTISVASTTGYVPDQFIQVDFEFMQITGVGSGTFTVVRGQLGTTAVTHLSGTGLLSVTIDNGGPNEVVWSSKGPNQTSSLYFTTLATSTSVCGSTPAYCAVKLTQSGLQ